MAVKTLLREESMWPVCRRQGGKAQAVGSLAVWVKHTSYSGVGRDEKTGVGICAAQLRSIKLINRVTGLLSDRLENVFSVYVHFLQSSALLVEHQEGHPACKMLHVGLWVVII